MRAFGRDSGFDPNRTTRLRCSNFDFNASLRPRVQVVHQGPMAASKFITAMRNKLASSVILSTSQPLAQRGTGIETMKKLLAIIALIIVTGAQALASAVEACTYAGYPCSQWEQMRDRW